MSSKGDEWLTPEWLYNDLNRRFQFKLDPCTTPENPLNTRYFYTEDSNGLVQDWRPGPVFMNPPYSQVKLWVAKAWAEARQGVLTVGLLRLDPTTKWWHTYVRNEPTWVWPFPKRLKFRGAPSSYPFPSCIVVWHGLR